MRALRILIDIILWSFIITGLILFLIAWLFYCVGAYVWLSPEKKILTPMELFEHLIGV